MWSFRTEYVCIEKSVRVVEYGYGDHFALKNMLSVVFEMISSNPDEASIEAVAAFAMDMISHKFSFTWTNWDHEAFLYGYHMPTIIAAIISQAET